MRLITYSDLHFEFGGQFEGPGNSQADVMILAGDIINFKNFQPLSRFLKNWENPVLYIAGNHEYYTSAPMEEGDAAFEAFLASNHPNVKYLRDEAVTINGVQFFAGTMWTDFGRSNESAMTVARRQMNDYRLIMTHDRKPITPSGTILLHQTFKDKLVSWLEQDLSGLRVVISHHSPVVNPNTQYGDSPLQPAFNSLDMLPIIERHQPHLWVYGHTHECDTQTIGKTQIISNQLGYPNGAGGFECKDFDAAGCSVDL
jgi:predicted phosphodiesterase